MKAPDIPQTGWLECIQAAAGILAPIAAIIASGIVIYGILAWRVEFIGKRRIELGEDLGDFKSNR